MEKSIYDYRRDEAVLLHCVRRGLYASPESFTQMLTDNEFRECCGNISDAGGFYLPQSGELSGEQLIEAFFAPSLVTRRRWLEHSLRAAKLTGTRQFIGIGSGLSTFWLNVARSFPDSAVFEVVHSDVLSEKQRRLANAGVAYPKNYHCIKYKYLHELNRLLSGNEFFIGKRPSFVSILGLVDFEKRNAIRGAIAPLSRFSAPGSSVVFALDYSAFAADDQPDADWLSFVLGRFGYLPYIEEAERDVSIWLTPKFSKYLRGSSTSYHLFAMH